MSVLANSYSIIRANEMTSYNPRLSFIKSITKAYPTTCPECEHPIEHIDDMIICKHCGLVCYDTNEYVGLRWIDYPFRY